MTILGNGRVVTPDAVLDPGWIELSGDRIVAVGGGSPPAASGGAEVVDLAGRLVVPGFVDTHVHGGGGASYTSADLDQISTVARFHRSHGTTSTFASLVSATREELRPQVTALARAYSDGVVAGIQLEGPWLSPDKRGAHDPSVLRPPAREEVAELIDLAAGGVKMVTLAPELDGGMAALRQVVDAGVVAAIGHTASTYDQARAALDAGASVGTHLYNAMPTLHHREPGTIAALLADERATVELIADGFHVHPAMLSLAIRSAGVDRVSLVTDAMQAAGLGDGEYTLGGRSVDVVDGQVRLAGGGSLAGSTLTMDAAFRYVVEVVGVSLVDAARMAATNPARAHGLTDVGALRTGLRADLVVLDDALRVTAVMAAGTWTHQDGDRNS